MKLTELRICDNCQGPLCPQMQFYVLRMSLALFNPHKYNQVAGLARMFNGAVGLAEVFAPEADCITVAGDKDPRLMQEFLICPDCYLRRPVDLAVMTERANEREKQREPSDD